MRNLLAPLALLILHGAISAAAPLDIGDRRELFLDDHLIESLTGDARQELQYPTPRDVALTTDKPWEGNTSAYFTVFRDGDRVRMYYRGAHYNTQTKKPTFTFCVTNLTGALPYNSADNAATCATY